MARDTTSPSKLRMRRRKRRMLVLYISVFALLVLFGTVVWLMHAPFLRLQTVEVSGTDTLDPSAIKQSAQEDLTGSYWHLFPKNNVLLYPRHAIEGSLLSAYPELLSVKVHAATLTTLLVEVKERSPAALWCGAAERSDGGCLLIDGAGLAYAPAPSFSEPVYVEFFGALPGDGGALPAQFLPQKEFVALLALVQALADKANAGSVSNVSIDGNNDVRLKFSSGFTLIFALRDDTGKILDHFELALSADPFSSHPTTDFDYLDLRFGSKLYYKLK